MMLFPAPFNFLAAPRLLVLLGPGRQPLIQGLGALAAGVPRQQSFNSDMFIKVGPMYGITISKQTPVLPFSVDRIPQARIPL